MHHHIHLATTAAASALLALSVAGPAQAVFFHIGSGSIDGSLCVGNDCVSSEAFGFDTIRLKENNLRIHFDDTSTAAGFPSNDWRLYANESASGGDSYFGLEDATAGRFVFRVYAGAPGNAMSIDSQGDVGIGVRTPALDLQITRGDTPSIRLEQNATSGFTPQTFDLAGNEAGFFIRDATNGSTLPFRIIPGASSQALVIDDDDDIGMSAGVNPQAALHVDRGSTSRTEPMLYLEGNMVNNQPMLLLEQTGGGDDRVEIWFRDELDGVADDLRLQLNGDDFNISFDGTGGAEFQVQKSGDVRVLRGDLVVTTGSVIVGGTTLNVPDYVFAPDYELMPLDDVAAFIADNSHLPHVPSAGHVQAGGLNMVDMQLALLKTVEEQMLHILALEARIKRLEADR